MDYVTGTGNKVEDFWSWFIQNMEMEVDLSPIADLMKSSVFFVSKCSRINSECGSDGLFGDEKTDQQQLGASYDELEWAMLEAEAGKTRTDFSGRQKTVFEIYKG
jgi:NAD+ synthase